MINETMDEFAVLNLLLSSKRRRVLFFVMVLAVLARVVERRLADQGNDHAMARTGESKQRNRLYVVYYLVQETDVYLLHFDLLPYSRQIQRRSC